MNRKETIQGQPERRYSALIGIAPAAFNTPLVTRMPIDAFVDIGEEGKKKLIPVVETQHNYPSAQVIATLADVRDIPTVVEDGTEHSKLQLACLIKTSRPEYFLRVRVIPKVGEDYASTPIVSLYTFPDAISLNNADTHEQSRPTVVEGDERSQISFDIWKDRRGLPLAVRWNCEHEVIARAEEEEFEKTKERAILQEGSWDAALQIAALSGYTAKTIKAMAGRVAIEKTIEDVLKGSIGSLLPELQFKSSFGKMNLMDDAYYFNEPEKVEKFLRTLLPTE